jgi:hypothetical protein
LKLCIRLASCVFVLTFAVQVAADPMLVVSDLGLNGSSNREWLVEIAPDPNLFGANGGSVALELGFEVSGSDLVGAVANSLLFPFDNPGNNPFTGGVTLGLQVDTVADTVFAAIGSNLFSTGDEVVALVIETMGSAATTVSWGGHTLLPGTAFEFTGSRIAQDGVNFDGYQGSLMSATNMVTGDFTGPGGSPDGVWDCLDIDALTNAIAAGSTDLTFDMNGDGAVSFDDVTDAAAGWLTVGGANNVANTGGNAFLVGDANLDGNVNGQDFIVWNGNKFTANAHWCGGNFTGDANVDGQDFIAWNANKFQSSDLLSTVPEPSSLVLIGLTLSWIWHRRR